MVKPLNTWLRKSIPVLFFICFGVFYFVFHAYRFGLQEQLHLFLFTPDYFKSFLSTKGWFVEYLSSFLMQFYAIRWVGSLTVVMIAFLSWLSTRNVFGLFLHDRTYASWYALAVPALMWPLFTFATFYPERALAVLFSLAAVIGYASVKNIPLRRIMGVVFAVFLWWFIGEAAFLTAGLVLLYEYREKKRSWGYLAFIAALYLSVPFIFRHTHVVATVPEIFGSDRYTDGFLGYYLGIYLFFMLSGLVLLVKKMKSVWAVVCVVFSFSMGYIACFKTSDDQMEILSRLDWLARHREWNRIIEETDKNQITHKNSIGYYFLALAETGQLGSRFLDKGVPMLSSFMASVQTPNYMDYSVLNEIYWETGLMRGSQFCNYEAIGILNSGMSGRHLKRMVESHMVFNELEVAGRYLKILSSTALYGAWAREQLAAIHADPSLDTITWVREKRRYIPSSSFLLNVRIPWNDLGELVKLQPDNRMANEYWLCCLLLQKKLEQFKIVFDRYMEHSLPGKRIPAFFQQAILLCGYEFGLSADEQLKYNYDRQTLSLFNEYVKVRTGEASVGNSGLSKSFMKSYFYYYGFTDTVTQ